MQTPALRKEEEASGRGEATVEESGERPAIGGRGRAVGGGRRRGQGVRGPRREMGGRTLLSAGHLAQSGGLLESEDWVFGCLGPTFARETLSGIGAVR